MTPSASDSIGRERWKRIHATARSGAAAYATSALVTFLTVPLTLGTLGTDGYALFLIITQMGALLAFSDLGVGNGLISPLTRALARGDSEHARSLVSSALLLMTAVVTVGGGLLIASLTIVPWEAVLGTPASVRAQVAPCIAAFFSAYLAGLPVNLVEKVRLGRQEGAITNYWRVLGALIALTLTVACARADATTVWFVVALTIGPLLANICNWINLMVTTPQMRPNPLRAQRSTTWALLGSGGLFLVLNVAAAIAYQTDLLVLSHFANAQAVVSYGLVMKVSSIPLMFATFMLSPMWPAFSDALARDDQRWMREGLRRAMKSTALISLPASAVLLLAGRPIIDSWSGQGS